VQAPRRAVEVLQLDHRGLVRALQDASADDTTKENAAHTLASFAWADANDAAYVAAYALPQLVALLRGGTDKGRGIAAAAIQNIVAGNNATAAAIKAAGALPLLVELRSGGSVEGRANAAAALCKLNYTDTATSLEI
jgi:hypothetical protein